MNIRDIEKIIDDEHICHKAFKQHYNQNLIDFLKTFQEMSLQSMKSCLLNPYHLNDIVNWMDALNISLEWNFNLCSQEDESIDIQEINKERFELCEDLFKNHAYPYSDISSGYISYSREKMDVSIKDKCVNFFIKDENNNSAWDDILREKNDNNLINFFTINDIKKINLVFNSIKKNSKIEDKKIFYTLDQENYDIINNFAVKQWNETKTLPDSWKFDSFTMKEFKNLWIAIAVICYVHLFSLFNIEEEETRINNGIIIVNKKQFIETVKFRSGLTYEKIETIIKYLTFDPSIKNNDIIYQPIIEIGNQFFITPTLIIGSRPERNLLCLIRKLKDKEYSREVNNLENLMISKIENSVKLDYTIHGKKLGDSLPDIDFGILDKKSNSALICEMKWFVAADSSKEIYARQEEINHGCKQMYSVMSYALEDKNRFFKRVFDVDNGVNFDLFCCVIARHNIRNNSKYIPVIDLERFINLIKTNSLNSFFNIIRNKQYEINKSENISVGYKEINYAGYLFRIPALIVE